MRRSRRKRLNKQKAERKQLRRKRVLAALAVFACLAAVDGAYLLSMSGRFYHRTRINGYDVSGKTAEETASLLAEPYDALTLNIEEQGTNVLSTSFRDMGYTVDRDGLTQAVKDLLKRQNRFLPLSLFTGERFGLRVPFRIDEEQYSAAVCAERFSVPRVATEDAELIEQDGSFVIQPEVYGTDFQDSELRNLVRETIRNELADGNTENVITFSVPESIYRKPQITQDSPDLTDLRALYNRYCGAEITYTFGPQTQSLTWDTIKTWLIPDRPEQPLDEEAVYNYVAELADTYDTIYLPRTFESTTRGTMTIDYNSYGYQIDRDGEFSQLMEDIASNTHVTREPVYAAVGYSRNGVDDLNGTYVEVDLSLQHLWFYKDGGLVAETDIISGLPTEERATHEGVFTIPYKASPFNLKGGANSPNGGTDTWDVEVQYWMPFDDGQGLHDANWQYAFGGNTYKTAGSHGCINLPVDAAAVIYNYMEENIAIIIYS